MPDPPTAVTRDNATLNARIYTTFGGAVTYWFRYGKTRAYERETPRRTIQLAPDSGPTVSERLVTSIIGLTPGTEYHWQVCTQDTEEQPPRTNCSSDRTFFTANAGCGDTITRDITLTRDVEGCENPLRVGADDITIDLGGHKVDGGILNNGFDGVTIRNGTLSFVVTPNLPETLLVLFDAADNHVSGLRVQGYIDGISVGGESGGTVIENSTISGLGIGLRISLGTGGVTVRGNFVRGEGYATPEKIAPLLVVGDDNVIEGNTAVLTASGFGRGIGQASISIRGDRNQILRNIANDSVTDGILVESEAEGTVLIGNTANNNGHEFAGSGIRVEPATTSLGDNVANDNQGWGIVAPTGVTDLGGNRASGNGATAQCFGVVCQ